MVWNSADFVVITVCHVPVSNLRAAPQSQALSLCPCFRCSMFSWWCVHVWTSVLSHDLWLQTGPEIYWKRAKHCVCIWDQIKFKNRHELYGAAVVFFWLVQATQQKHTCRLCTWLEPRTWKHAPLSFPLYEHFYLLFPFQLQMLRSDKRCLCVVSVDTVYQQVLHYAIRLYVSICLFICVHKGIQKRLNNKHFYGYNKQTNKK